MLVIGIEPTANLDFFYRGKYSRLRYVFSFCVILAASIALCIYIDICFGVLEFSYSGLKALVVGKMSEYVAANGWSSIGTVLWLAGHEVLRRVLISSD